MKRAFRILILLVVVVGLALLLSKFFEENSEQVQLQLLGWRTKSISSGALFFGVFALGFVLSFLITFTAMIAKSLEAGRFRRENLALQRLLEEKASKN